MINSFGEAVLKKLSKEFQSDVIGFGRILSVKEPKIWKSIKDDWKQQLSKAKFYMETDIRIKGSGLLR